MRFRLCEEFFELENFQVGDRIRALLSNNAEYIGKITELTEDYIKISDDCNKESVIESKDLDKIKRIDISETFENIPFFDNIERESMIEEMKRMGKSYKWCLLNNEQIYDIYNGLNEAKRKPYRYPKNAYNMKQTDGMKKAKIGNPDPELNASMFNKNMTYNTAPSESSTGQSAGGDGGGAACEALEKHSYTYDGPVYRFDKYFDNVKGLGTTAVSSSAAYRNMCKQLKDNYGLDASASLSIDRDKIIQLEDNKKIDKPMRKEYTIKVNEDSGEVEVIRDGVVEMVFPSVEAAEEVLNTI